MFRHPIQGLFIRPVAEAERDAAVADVRKACEDPEDRAALDGFAGGWSGRICRLVVAEHGNRVAGLAGWQQDEMVGLIRVHLVAPAYRDRGVGTALLAGLVAQAREAGVRFLEAALPEAALQAQRIYRRQGFREMGPAGERVYCEKYLGGKP